jgi:hypothetical protein
MIQNIKEKQKLNTTNLLLMIIYRILFYDYFNITTITNKQIVIQTATTKITNIFEGKEKKRIQHSRQIAQLYVDNNTILGDWWTKILNSVTKTDNTYILKTDIDQILTNLNTTFSDFYKTTTNMINEQKLITFISTPTDQPMITTDIQDLTDSDEEITIHNSTYLKPWITVAEERKEIYQIVIGGKVCGEISVFHDPLLPYALKVLEEERGHFKHIPPKVCIFFSHFFIIQTILLLF